MKIALVQAPVWGTREPPLALVQLSGCLKGRGIQVRSFDFNNYLYRNRSGKFNTLWAWEQSMAWYDRNWVDKFFSDFFEVVDLFALRVIEFMPDVVGFSVSASTYHASCRMADFLKEKKKDLIVVFGGSVFIDVNHAESSFRDSRADYVVTGDGDEIFPRLAEVLEKGGDISECSGVYYRDGEGVGCTGGYPIVKKLDKSPYMDFSDLRIEDYDDKVHIALMSARGCVWNCTFCSTRAFSPGYRMMSAERIHQEVTYQRICNYDRNRKDNLGHVDFMDLEINGDMKRVVEFCELMIKYPPCAFLPRMKWVANAIIHPGLTLDAAAKMARAGCKKLIFGIESGSEKVLKLMKKKYSVEAAKRVIKDVSESGIEVTLNFMFGFPGEKEKDFLKTLDFIKDVGKYVERVYPSRTYCAVEQYSYLQENLEEFGIKTPVNHHLYWETCDGENNYPVRLQKCARFEKFCDQIGVQVDRGVKTAVDMDNWFNLGYYYDYKKEYIKALEFFMKYLDSDPDNRTVRNKLGEIYNKVESSMPEGIKNKISSYRYG